MKKIILGFTLATILALVGLLGQPALAVPSFSPAKVVNIRTAEAVANIVVPQEAIAGSQTIVPLGFALDNERLVQGYAIIHYKREQAKREIPQGKGKDGNKNKGDSNSTASCYDFLAKGARWKITESYVVASDIDAMAVARDLDAWDSQVAFDIFGTQDLAMMVDGADVEAPDNKNEIMFGDISDPGAIAVTIVWGVFNGPPQNRELVEYDVVFDNVDYEWGDATVDPGIMDFENIATHEFGHAAGLADLYRSKCSQQTMYGYADFGETIKRTLEIGDITGIKELYQ